MPPYTNGHVKDGGLFTKMAGNKKAAFDMRIIIRYLGIGVVGITVLTLLISVLPSSDSYNDPFRVDRSPSTKYVVFSRALAYLDRLGTDNPQACLPISRATWNANCRRKTSTCPQSWTTRSTRKIGRSAPFANNRLAR